MRIHTPGSPASEDTGLRGSSGRKIQGTACFGVVALWACHLACAGTPVPGTRWHLSDEIRTDDDARGHFELLAERLPVEYRKPGVPVRFRMEDALPPRPRGRRALARVSRRGRRVTLYVRGLAGRLEEEAADITPFEGPEGFHKAAAYLTRRAIVHELTHVVDRRMKLSRRSDWRALSGWSYLSYLPRAILAGPSSDFATDYGAKSPAEDLATFAEVYFLPPPLGPTDAERHPMCRMAGKFEFFQETFSPHPHPAPNVVCPRPEDVGLGSDTVRAVSILWAAPTLSSPASMAGHLILVVDADEDGDVRRHAFGMLADTGDIETNSLLYLAYGVMGGFFSMVTQEPLEPVALRYVKDEHRDVTLYRWNLDGEEQERLLARLDALLLYWDRPYFFFQRNCSAIVTELWETVGDAPRSLPYVVPPDLVLARLARQGRLTRCDAPRAYRPAPVTQALHLKRARQLALRDFQGGDFSAASRRNTARRDQGYRDLLAHARDRNSEEAWEGLARIMLMSVPLEQALRSSQAEEEGEKMDGFEHALAAVREHVPLERRMQIHAGLQQKVIERGRGEETGWAGMYTPYVPVEAAWEIRGRGTAPPEPFLAIRRDAMDLRRGEPRLFAPAQGIAARFLSAKGALGLHAPHRRILEYQVMQVEYQPEPLLGRLAPGLGLNLLQARVEGMPLEADFEWLGARGLLRLAGTPGSRQYLNAYAGLSGGSRLRDGIFNMRASAPMGLHGAAWTRGRILAGFESQAEWSPVVSPDGIAYRIDHWHSAEVAVARVAGAAVRLRLGGGAGYETGPEGWQRQHVHGSIGVRVYAY